MNAVRFESFCGADDKLNRLSADLQFVTSWRRRDFRCLDIRPWLRDRDRLAVEHELVRATSDDFDGFGGKRRFAGRTQNRRLLRERGCREEKHAHE